jgi:hypothetical protein
MAFFGGWKMRARMTPLVLGPGAGPSSFVMAGLVPAIAATGRGGGI